MHDPPSSYPLRSFFWFVVAVLMVGCGEPKLPVGLVSGTVSVDGEALGEISVAFIPARKGEGPNPASGAITTDDGRYTLRYSIPNDRDLSRPTEGDGAIVGSHTVVLSDFKMKNEMLPPPGRVPLEYTKRDTTPLRFEVQQGEQTFDIEL